MSIFWKYSIQIIIPHVRSVWYINTLHVYHTLNSCAYKFVYQLQHFVTKPVTVTYDYTFPNRNSCHASSNTINKHTMRVSCDIIAIMLQRTLSSYIYFLRVSVSLRLCFVHQKLKQFSFLFENNWRSIYRLRS